MFCYPPTDSIPLRISTVVSSGHQVSVSVGRGIQNRFLFHSAGKCPLLYDCLPATPSLTSEEKEMISQSHSSFYPLMLDWVYIQGSNSYRSVYPGLWISCWVSKKTYVADLEGQLISYRQGQHYWKFKINCKHNQCYFTSYSIHLHHTILFYMAHCDHNVV